jgi:type IX secretion system PorP/SprF family membrane protein
MRKFLLLAILTFLFLHVYSQQQALYSQYSLNKFLFNPAYAGSEEFKPIQISARSQWVGIDGAPKTLAVSGHSSSASNTIGLGGYIFSDHYGPTARSGALFAYSYKMSLYRLDSKIAFGLSISAFQYRLDQSKFRLVDDISLDNAITGQRESAFAPDAAFGVYVFRPNYHLGFAVNQLIGMDLKFNSENKNSMVRHYYLSGGYLFELNDDFSIEPGFLLKATETSPVQLDISIRTLYKENYWLSVAYRTKNTVIALVGFNIDRYYLGYSYDYTFSSLANYSTGSHEILVGVYLGKKKAGSSLL